MLIIDKQTIETATLHSRSALAGYEPELLFGVKVLVVGAGALGQNLLQNLALSGVGELAIVDFDIFQAHNATRSPLYPTSEEGRQWGFEKAVIVAHKVRKQMTAPVSHVRYACKPIQQVGDSPISWADLVFSAVDSQSTRGYLAERCRLLSRPLVEAGFHGPELSLALFGPAPSDPCYRCQHPDKTGAFSCTRYALAAEEEGIIPAIQNGAGVLAALQAEVGIGWLHGDRSLLSHRVYIHIRKMSMQVVRLLRDVECPAPHWNPGKPPLEVAVRPEDSLVTLLSAVEERVGRVKEIRLPDDIILRIPCTECLQLADARCPEWRWLLDPRCKECGGPFPRSRRATPERDFRIPSNCQELEGLTCAEAGLASGSSAEVFSADGARQLVRLPGGMDGLVAVEAD